jgi:hypothetical protein
MIRFMTSPKAAPLARKTYLERWHADAGVAGPAREAVKAPVCPQFRGQSGPSIRQLRPL